MKCFRNLSEILNANCCSEAAVTANTRIGTVELRESGEELYGNIIIEGKFYLSCVQEYGSETWCLNDEEVAIFKITERAMLRVMYGVKLVDKKTLVN